MDREKIGVAVGLAVIVAALALRVWWVQPQVLPGGELLERILVRGGDYELVPKESVPIEEMVNTEIFDGYRPFENLKFKEQRDLQEPSQQGE